MRYSLLLIVDIDMNRQEFEKAVTVMVKPVALLVTKNNGHKEHEGVSKVEPHVGMEFDSAEDAQEFYNLYATQMGFRIRIGQLYRSRVDGSVISRRFVCSKEGFQANSRTGCPAFIRVQKGDSGKWVMANVHKEHNHQLELICPSRTPRQTLPTPRPTLAVSTRTGIRSHDEEGPSKIIDVKCPKRDRSNGDLHGEPYKGLEFVSANEAYKFYCMYAANNGFRVRIGQLFRSKNDGSITSRRFVCSKEGHQHPSRVGCGVFMRIQRQESGRWVVDRFQKDHNHEVGIVEATDQGTALAAKGSREEEVNGLEHLDLVETNGGLSLVKRRRGGNIGSNWYAGKKQENLGALLVNSKFKCEFEACVSQSQTAGEFDSAWDVLMDKYNLKENSWLKEMYRVRRSWVPLHLKSSFFAGIPLDGSFKSYFGTVLMAQTSLDEFIVQYEKVVEQRREEERKEDFNSFNLQPILRTKDPIEEQCQRLYTMKMFKVVQKEVLECYSYGGIRINVEGAISRLQDFKALMKWSLREEAHDFIEAGTASSERYKFAFEILKEGKKNLCWQTS
ncbi:OLC1v1020235C1 [Oldenlandia corymbosa var. corymbosa]|uniref:Protein FAR1-RELATED SEQUENCE n=1 Tax=Oldenlandia corymbosa var. corymbosa TaxID=529605 RepID=A0AAV1EG27_OLDCO|nr:OLC1v1020235C1 [Oldenlandia corymbosa var. corymbosa]